MAAPQLAGYVLIALLNVVIKTPVTDQAAVLPRAEREAIDARLRALREQRGPQMAVLTIPSTQGEALPEFSIRTAKAWGGGRKGHDDGLLLTLAVSEKQIRLEVGYGLEGRLPDAEVGHILDSVRDDLRQKHYGQAFLQIIEHVDARLQPESAGVAAAGPSTTPAPGDSAHPVVTPLPDPPHAVIPSAFERYKPLEPEPLGTLLYAPLLGLLIGYVLGIVCTRARSDLVDVMVVMALISIVAISAMLGTHDTRNYYLAVSLGVIGASSLVARGLGLRLLGFLIASAVGALASWVMLGLKLAGDVHLEDTQSAYQQCLRYCLGLGAVVQVFSAWVIAVKEIRLLWSSDRARNGDFFRGSSSSSSSYDSGWGGGGGGGGGGSGGGGGDYSGGGGDFGGGGASSSFD